MIDAHTHLGLDEDGRSLTLEQLLAQLDAAEARRACVFPLHDPERQPAYSVPNDRVLAWAGESDGRLVPFCRLDPAEGADRRGRTLPRHGARGIKLHPRAQDFVFDGGDLDGVFKLAEEARVPILIHAGRGLPPLADGLVDLALRHPGAVLILAHGAICDQGILTTRLADHPGVLYDISCFFPLDVIELFARVPAERIVFASDPPYGLPGDDALHGAASGAPGRPRRGDDQAGARRDDGGAARRRRAAAATTPPRRGPSITLSGRLARVYGYASLVGPALFTGVAEQARAMLDMAIAALRDPDPGEDGEALETIGRALRAADELAVEERRRAPGDRPRLPRERARRDAGRRRRLAGRGAACDIAGRVIPATAPPTPPRCGARARACRGGQRRRRRPRRPRPSSRPPAISSAGGRASAPASSSSSGAQQVREHDRRPAGGGSPAPTQGSGSRRRSRRRASSATALTAAFSAAAATLSGSLSSPSTGP